MNWKELYALVNENIKNAVSGLYKPAGDVTFAELPELSQSVLGYTYTVTDAFTTDNRFTDYDTETQTGHSFPADTEVAVIVTGTTENPVYMFNVMGGIMDGYATKGDLDNYVEKEAGKSLSTNDYTDADKALVQDSPITVSATGSDLALSTSSGNISALTVYGKSEVVDGSIKSAGEGYAVVDLGTLGWIRSTSYTNAFYYTTITGIKGNGNGLTARFTKIANTWARNFGEVANDNEYCFNNEQASEQIYIRCDEYTNATHFKNAMSGVLLCYEEATPTNNTIAVKTDNGSGIDGTMAVFETGTPLYGVSDTVRDVMTWDGSAGTVTKNCAEEDDLGSFDYVRMIFQNVYYFRSDNIKTTVKTVADTQIANIYMSGYETVPADDIIRVAPNHTVAIDILGRLYIRTDEIDNVTDFKTAMSGVKLIYELATPTTEQLTTAENASIAGLRTFAPQTHAQNNAGATMTVEAYAGTANGRAIADLKTELQITQSDTLTLTVAGWSNNAQTIAFAHDTAKRNVIDVDPSSVEEWASCGVLATAETATSITFTCKTVPENALNFRVTSMGVN